jgi:hypothetical protein
MLTSVVLLWGIGMLVLGAAVFGLIVLLRNRSITVKWYEWLIFTIGLVLFLFTIQNFYASFVEFESDAGLMFLLVFGLPSVILLAAAWQLVARRQRAG